MQMNDDSEAVLVIAHGSPLPCWNEMVEQAVLQAELPLPTLTAYLGGQREKSIDQQLARLEHAGHRHITVVPLFISQASTHLDEIRYMLGFVQAAQVETRLQPVCSQAKLIWHTPIEDSAEARQIWLDRVRDLSTSPSEEALLVIGHGSDVAGFQQMWQLFLQQATAFLQTQFHFRAAAFATLRPDTVAAQTGWLKKQGKLVVLPLFMSEGYFTQSLIPNKMAGFNYRYSGKGYLPHPLLSAWLRRTVTSEIR